MRSRPFNAQASFLPSKKSQKASEERIAKINGLYEDIKKGHRDSVVSNNSTSVASQEGGADDCIPISNLDFRLPKVNHIDQAKRKQENDTIGLFRTDQTSTPSVRRHLSNGFHPNESHADSSYGSRDDEDNDDDLEAELRFTPKLKSRRSLITMRSLSNSEGDRVNDSYESIAGSMRSGGRMRRTSRISSLRKTLGEPLPLPYVNKENSLQFAPTSSDPFAEKSTVENKRQLMEKKWRSLIARDKELIEKRFADLRQQTLSETKPAFGDTPPSSVSTIPEKQPDNVVLELSKEIIRNREKLDDIIRLLTERPAADVAPVKTQSVSRETRFWTICIIVLIICNIYVYHYF